MPQELRRTPLYEQHVALGAKIVPFAGWEMPVWYSGLPSEHVATRSSAGLFDVSHMGELFVEGPQAEAMLNHLTTRDVSKLVDGQAHYTVLTTPTGGVVDDLIIYRFSREKYLLCVNASNVGKDLAWLNERNRWYAAVIDRSAQFGQIALQGPRAFEVLKVLCGQDLRTSLRLFHFVEMCIGDAALVIARTGYTGEDGVEIFVDWNQTAALWQKLVEAGKPFELQPCGLGARDTLRMEAALPLYGHELGLEISAIESGLGWVVSLNKGEFLGREVLARQKREGARRTLVGFAIEDPGIARDGCLVFNVRGEEIGYVTSGTKTPTLNVALGMALLKTEFAAQGTSLQIDVRGKKLRAHVVKLPFYRRADLKQAA